MKVLFVHDHRFYEINGKFYSTKFSEATWKPYIMDNNQVTVFARRTDTSCPQVASCNGVEFRLTQNYSTPMDALFNYRKLKKELEPLVESSDCVIIRMPSILGLIASRIAISKRKKIMAEVVGDAYDAYRYYGNLRGIVFAPMFGYLNRRVISKCTAALYVTQSYLQSRYPTTGVSCACSDVLIENVSSMVLENRVKKNCNRQKSALVCGEIGNISVPYKGYRIMLKAMQILRKRNIPVEYHIVGGGDPRKVLKLAEKYGVRDSVYYDGMMDHRFIEDFYDSIDVYVHPSFLEGLPRVVVEAMNRGCPCVASNVGGVPELIAPEFIHEKGDAEKLADDLARFYVDRETMTRASILNFERAKAYAADLLEQKRLDFYNKFYML